MENNDKRAEQFLPFDALKGFKEEIKKREKVLVDKIILSEEDEKELNYYLTQLHKGMEVQIVYFKSNQYIEVKGLVSFIDEINKVIQIVKTRINIDDILSIKSQSIIPYEKE